MLENNLSNILGVCPQNVIFITINTVIDHIMLKLSSILSTVISHEPSVAVPVFEVVA
jgi:hypothetical protein